MPIDIALKKELQADLEKRFQADTQRSINWKPTFSRVKIQPDPEALSGVLAVQTADTLIRGTIVSVGPDTGWRDGKQIERFYPGQKVLYMRSHVMTYKGADGVMHHFLKENADVNSIIAIEDEPQPTSLEKAALAMLEKRMKNGGDPTEYGDN